MNIRASGILLHISSLPSRLGIGDMGPWAYRFADFLEETKQSYWQIIPLTPPNPYHYSPYHSPSAFAGNPLLISPEILVQEGLLDDSDVESAPSFPVDRVDFPAVMKFKDQLLEKAFERFSARSDQTTDLVHFCLANQRWLDDYALFNALSKRFQGKLWSEWPEELRDRRADTLERWSEDLSEAIKKERFIQYLFFKQWYTLQSLLQSETNSNHR